MGGTKFGFKVGVKRVFSKSDFVGEFWTPTHNSTGRVKIPQNYPPTRTPVRLAARSTGRPSPCPLRGLSGSVQNKKSI